MKTKTILLVFEIFSVTVVVLVFNSVWEPVADTCGKFYKP
jgi:hypothetical protein